MLKTSVNEFRMTSASNKIAVTFPISGRETRFILAQRGEAPKEFFYGTFPYINSGKKIKIIDSRTPPKNLIGKLSLKAEYFYRRFQKFPISISRALATWDEIKQFEQVVSFTDYHSLSLGALKQKYNVETKIIGGFHGLSDIYHNYSGKDKIEFKKKVNYCLSGLDKIFFFGSPDKHEAISTFSLDEKKCHLFQFGIDTSFWHPSEIENDSNFILSVGSDINRDYETLVSSSKNYPLKIVTAKKIKNSNEHPNLSLINGSLHKSKITDKDLRDLYQTAKIIVIPLKDVWQPSGYSVALQAMASGKPIIITDFKGLWNREFFKHNENCLLVKSGCEISMKKAIQQLWENEKLQKDIGNKARIDCSNIFNLEKMNESFTKLISTY